MAISISTDYFSRSTTEHLKGYLALGVLLHHLCQHTNIINHESILGFFMQSLGYCCVSLFFFISGYGLSVSFNKHSGGGYLINYQRNRVLPIFAVNALLVLMYATLKLLLHYEVTVSNFVLSFFYGGDIVEYGWYLPCIMLFYEVFYFSAKYCGRHIPEAVLGTTVLYMALCLLFNMPSFWYMSSLAFPCGVLFARYKPSIDIVIIPHYALWLSLIVVLYLGCFALLYMVSVGIMPDIIPGVRLSLTSALGLLFSIMTVCALMATAPYLKRETFVSRHLCAIYLEIYVMQGFAFMLLRNERFSLDNDCLFIVSSIVLTLTFAALIHPVFKKLMNLVKVQNNNAKPV